MTGFVVTKLAAGVAVDSGICVIVVTCVSATPSLCLLLARRVLWGEAVPTVYMSLLPSSVPLHSDQGGCMPVSRVSVSAADVASRASCPPA